MIPTPQLWVVSAPVAGMVANLLVGRGDHVIAGQPLVVLESPSFVSQQRDYLHAIAQEHLASQQLKRNMDLFEGKAVPQRVLEASQAEARQATLVVAERRQMLHLSGMSDEAMLRLGQEAAISGTLTVNAPQTASVVELTVSPGQRIEQSAPLVKLARLSPLWAEIAVPAAHIRAIRVGSKVEIAGYPTAGKVVLVSETIDPGTQTILVRAELPNDGELHPGQTAAAASAFSPQAKARGRSRTTGWCGEASRPRYSWPRPAVSGWCRSSWLRKIRTMSSCPARSRTGMRSRSAGFRRFAAFSLDWGNRCSGTSLRPRCRSDSSSS